MTRRATLGQFLINELLPEDMRDYQRILDKGGMTKLLQVLAEKHPEQYREVLHKLTQFAREATTATGGQSFGLEHLRMAQVAKQRRAALKTQMRALLDDDRLDDDTREAKLLALAKQAKQGEDDAIYEESLKEENPLAYQVLSGSRGNKANLAALRGSDMLYEDHKGRVIPVPVMHSYSQGLTPLEYWAGSYGARQGVLATKLATADAGYLCLDKDTLVRMADESTKRICEIVSGDMVLGADMTGYTFPVKVTAVFHNGMRECVKTTFLDWDGVYSVVVSTGDHKFLAWPASGERQPVPIRVLWETRRNSQTQLLAANTRMGLVAQQPVTEMCDTYDIEVGHPDHLFVLANGAIVSNSKQLNQASHRLLVTALDDEEESPNLVGLPVDINDDESEGALLAQETGGYKRNTILTPKIIRELRGQGIKRLLVRSPAVGGPPDGGLYARDAGVREKGGLPPRGEMVGLIAASALCLAEDTLVRMADWSTKPIWQVEPGELVMTCSVQGVVRPGRVIQRYDNGPRECYETTYRLGTGRTLEKNLLRLVSTLDHKILGMCPTRSDEHPAPAVMEVRMNPDYPTKTYCAKLSSGYDDSGCVAEPFALALGLVIGDGCYTGGVTGNGVSFSCHDDSLVTDTCEYFAKLGLKLVAQSTYGEYRISDALGGKRRKGTPTEGTRNALRAKLVECALWGQRSHQKVLPDVRNWDNYSVASLLAGLWATDGTVAPTRNGCVLQYGSNSYALVQAVKDLLALRFGVYGAAIATNRKKRPDGTWYRDMYHVSICSYENIRRFAEVIHIPGVKGPRLTQILADWAARGGTRNESGRCRMVAQMQVGTRDTYDLEVDHPDHLFLLANGLVVKNSEPLSQGQLCLAEETLVRMANGSVKQLKEILAGDWVLGSDKQGRTFPVQVLQVFENGERECVETWFQDQTSGPLKVTSTVDHKFLCQVSLSTLVLPIGELYSAKDGLAETTNGQVRPTAQRSVGKVRTRDIEVDHPDHLFVLANGLIVSNSAKHAGGVAGGSKAVSGFAFINNLVQTPKIFPGGATHAEADGTIDRIAEAPAGGWHVYVNNQEHYVPADRPLKVKRGQYVEAGDVLSEGVPSPGVVVAHKGIGEGRRYFVQAFRDAFRDAGVKATRRNIEVLSKGLINHVRLTGEFGDYAPDDVVPYSLIERSWQPRAGAGKRPAVQAVGKYLERPVLHYTIGTKIRPSMLKDFQDFGVKELEVHDDPPPFEAEMQRGMTNLQHDPDWMTQMYGSGLKGSLLEAAQRGATSDAGGTSFVPGLARAVDFGVAGKVQTPRTQTWDS